RLSCCIVLLRQHRARLAPGHPFFFCCPYGAFRDRRYRGPRWGLIRVDFGWRDRDRRDLTHEKAVDAGRVGFDGVLAAADELRAYLLRDLGLEVEDRRPVREERNPDGLERRRQRRSAAGERVAGAADAQRATTEDTEDTEDVNNSPHSN